VRPSHEITLVRYRLMNSWCNQQVHFSGMHVINIICPGLTWLTVCRLNNFWFIFLTLNVTWRLRAERSIKPGFILVILVLAGTHNIHGSAIKYFFKHVMPTGFKLVENKVEWGSRSVGSEYSVYCGLKSDNYRGNYMQHTLKKKNK